MSTSNGSLTEHSTTEALMTVMTETNTRTSSISSASRTTTTPIGLTSEVTLSPGSRHSSALTSKEASLKSLETGSSTTTAIASSNSNRREDLMLKIFGIIFGACAVLIILAYVLYKQRSRNPVHGSRFGMIRLQEEETDSVMEVPLPDDGYIYDEEF